jgi:hypothetical protein
MQHALRQQLCQRWQSQRLQPTWCRALAAQSVTQRRSL